MKLLSIRLVGSYKGLIDQEFNFSECTDAIHAFVGLNGSGKSQVLELIAEVFAYLERCKRQDFRVRNQFPFSFEVVYQTTQSLNGDETSFQVTLDEGGALACNAASRGGGWQTIPIDELDLPDQIIGYSSGLNENLQRSFLKNTVQFYDVMAARSARRKRLAGDLNELQVAKINRYYLARHPGVFEQSAFESEIEDGFLSLREGDTELPAVKFLDYDSSALLMTSIAILPREEIEQLMPEIQFRYPRKIVLSYDLRGLAIEEDTIRDIRELVRTLGTEAIAGRGQPLSDEKYEVYELDYLIADITLDLSKQSVRERLYERFFGEPLGLFERLYKIQLLGVRNWKAEDKRLLRQDDFFGTVKKPLKSKLPLSVSKFQLENSKGQTIEFDDLSDGEAQLVQILSACRMFRDRNTLFIFDEPETHLNPSWRTRFHQYLVAALARNAEENLNVDVFLSTHSPFLVSSLHRENVFSFERTEDGTISMVPVVSETYGAAFDVLLKRFFGLNTLISQTAVEEIKRQIDSVDSAQARDWIESNIGDSMERAYLLRKLSS